MLRQLARIAPAWLTALALLTCFAGCQGTRSQGLIEPRTPGLKTELSKSEDQRRVYLAGSWSPADLSTAAELAPNVEVIAGLDRESALAYADRAQAVEAQLLSEEFLARAEQLVWIQSLSAGVDQLVSMPGLVARPELLLTNAKGTYGPVIAEHVLALMLAHTRGLAAWRSAQERGAWRGASPTLGTLTGHTLLVVGMGGIGEEVASRAHGLGMRVLATVRTARPAPAFVERLETAEALDALLPEAEFLAICLPLTEETRGLFDATKLARLPKGAYLVNIARGPIVDTAALVAALESGQLSGAGLDVTDPEPLPSDHPLWSLEGVTITPHVAAQAELSVERQRALLIENLRRFGAGEPLLNPVDRQAGY